MKDFSTYDIHSSIVTSLVKKGISTPTEIQSKAIPVLLKHDGDIVVSSPTGTGKTFAYGASLLSRINTQKGKIQAIVLVPTRELCKQVGEELSFLASEIYSLKIEAIYGGIPLKAQIHELSNGTHLIVATPGRLTDLIKRKVVDLSSLDIIVFDEADEMLLKGFQTDIDEILSQANRQYNSWLFSATLPDDVHIIVKKYLHKALKKVLLTQEQKTNTEIKHCCIIVKPEEKLEVLLHHLTTYKEQKGIVFCKTKSGVQKLYKQLSANKLSCGAIHGNLPQGLRDKVMEQYRNGDISLLIATDVAARGIDIDDTEYVIQYHLPDTTEAYVHRSGRTSRIGNKGISLTFIFPEESEKLSDLERKLKVKFEELTLPTMKDQLINKAILWARKISKQKSVVSKLEFEQIEAFKKELNHLSKEELLEKILADKLREYQA